MQHYHISLAHITYVYDLVLASKYCDSIDYCDNYPEDIAIVGCF